jgi:lipopolysaccharide export system permease protein
MRISLRLSLYLGRNFLLSYMAAIAILVGLKFFMDLVDYGRKAAAGKVFTFDIAIEMAALLAPLSIELMTPSALLAAGMYTMWRMARHNELVAVRAAGISVWQLLIPALLFAVLAGGFILGLVNPLGSGGLVRHNVLYSTYINDKNRAFKVSSVGVWLREVDADGVTVIHADRARNTDAVRLIGATVLMFDSGGAFQVRIDAKSATLGKGHWRLTDAVMKRPRGRDEPHEFIDLKTELTASRIQDGVVEPKAISFWRLPEIIKMTEAAGFTAVRYRIHWNALLASPVLFCAMMLLAATFSLRAPRRGGTMKLITAGLVAGFTVELLKYIMVTLGNFGQIPVLLAAWTPAAAASMFAIAALFHVEDG